MRWTSVRLFGGLTTPLPREERTICLARFIARDPYDPEATASELEEVVPRLHGVVDWNIHADGDVTIEYFRNPVSEELIEEALGGIGYQVKHIYDHKGVDEVEVQEALSH
jgi:hypothetical protein